MSFRLHIQIKELGLGFLRVFAVRRLFAALADIIPHPVVVVVKFRTVPTHLAEGIVKTQPLPGAGGKVDHLALIGHHRVAAGRARQMGKAAAR